MSQGCQLERNLDYRDPTFRIDNLDQLGIGIIINCAAVGQAAGNFHNNLLFRVALGPP